MSIIYCENRQRHIDTDYEEEICEICGLPLSETQNNKHNHEDEDKI